MNKYDVIIVTREPFPIGLAATNRILTYATELAKTKKVKVIVTCATELEKDIKNTQTIGTIKSLDFEYACDTTVWPSHSSSLVKMLFYIRGLFRTLLLIKKHKPKALIYVTRDTIIPLALKLISLFQRCSVYREISEVVVFPKYLIKRKLIEFENRMIDGHIVMTSEIQKQLKGIRCNNSFVLPMTVDMSRFQNNSMGQSKKYFMYCCGNTWERDGAIVFIKAFELFCSYRSDYELWMAGNLNSNNPYHEEIKRIVASSSYSRNMKLLGHLHSYLIPELLMNSTAAVLSPTKDYDSGGFPTKLGEYLASGVPVICTAVSEIPLYLDQTNSFLVPPNSVEAIANAMQNITDNPERAKEIGLAGRTTAKRFFSASSYIDKLVDFLNI